LEVLPLKLTTATIKTLALPAGVRDKTFWDDNLGGFGLRLREGGAARWVVQYDLGGKTKRVTLGTTAMLDLGAARAKARDILAAVRLGNDPAAEKRQAHERAAETFGALLARYLPHKQAQLKAGSRSFKEVERHLTKYARSLHARPVTAIDRGIIAELVSTIASKNGPTAANCMLGSLSGYFGWLIREGLISDVNPASYVNKAAANKSRDRVLTPDEFREIWNAFGDSDYADIFRLLAYTAARKSEIGGLRWDEVDLDDAAELRLPASRCKNGKPHVIPLSDPALAILRARPRNGRDFVFGTGQGYAGWAWAKRALDERIAAARKAAGIKAPMPPWVLHDLRRFFSTNAHDKLGIQPHIVEACLGHVSGFKSGVSGVYNKADYLDERRRALEKWAGYAEGIVTGKRPAAEVVRLRK
jgi:integrase